MDAGQPLCLPCARIDHLEFLPAGDTALTRRATKYSARVAVVVRFSRSRKRYERQGILVEPAALQKAEEECTEDAGERAAARVRGAERRRTEIARWLSGWHSRSRRYFPAARGTKPQPSRNTRRGEEAAAWAARRRAESWMSKP